MLETALLPTSQRGFERFRETICTSPPMLFAFRSPSQCLEGIY